MQLCSSLSIIWHCLSLRLEWKLTFFSPVATADLDREAWCAAIHGVAKSRTRPSDLAHMHIYWGCFECWILRYGVRNSKEDRHQGPISWSNFNWYWSVFIPIAKKGNAKECSNYRTIALISHASKVILKFSKPGFSNMWTVNFLMFKLVLEKAEEPEIKFPTSAGS